jgi:4-hydroxymandelate oxidase
MSTRFTRRASLATLGAWAAASPLLDGQPPGPRLQGEAPGRIPPVADLVNTFEVEAIAQRRLASDVYALVAGGDRRALDHILFRPRRFNNVEHLDLTVDLFGQKMFTPILVGPAAHQQRFHADGELAVARAAAATQTAMVISDKSDQPVDKIVAEAKTAPWYQIAPEADMAPVLSRVQTAVKAGCKAVCLTVGLPYERPSGPMLPSQVASNAPSPVDWDLVSRVRQAAGVPLLLKGIMNADEAKTAVSKGASGIIVSNNGTALTGVASPIEVLPRVVDAVGKNTPVLIDGGFRRGTDVVKALAFGARAVLVVRPVLWGLGAYGSDGVETVLHMMQSETARTIGLCGHNTLAELDRSMVRVSKH